MDNIRDAFFDKAIAPIERVALMWKTIFFLRIWRLWLHLNDYSASDHFVTQNVYISTELNGHLLLNILYSVVHHIFPVDSLRVWTCGSQACEQTFRLLRSMTPTFSTIVNFSMKGVLQRIHKLNYLATVESSEEIIFPRVKRRLLQRKEESVETFKIPSLLEIENCILEAKMEAVSIAKDCGMNLETYGDQELLFKENEAFINSAVDDDQEVDLTMSEGDNLEVDENIRPLDESITLNEDISQILLSKRNSSGIPIYIPVSQPSSARVYALKSRRDTEKSPFVEYQGVYIRKSTALYLLQENPQLSNDRLLRVRSAQPTHLFSGTRGNDSGPQQRVYSNDLCFFRRIDSEKLLIGRVVQFSYLEGSKRAREYSSLYVDTSIDSCNSIGVFANWFQGAKETSENEFVSFIPLDGMFTIGYLSMKYYVATIDENVLCETENAAFSIPASVLSNIEARWKDLLSFDIDFLDQ